MTAGIALTCSLKNERGQNSIAGDSSPRHDTHEIGEQTSGWRVGTRKRGFRGGEAGLTTGSQKTSSRRKWC